ncbi:hypothetical protein niasHT_011542 [Heterodera trifolii]|uniref:Uncharacterized protein n=1 Tax=Heterodera trifolii TaxID=157864 RepID=A0ABD2LIW4_9BILA
MVPWWSSNPSTLNTSMESIEGAAAGEQHRHVRPVHATLPAADEFDGIVVVGQGVTATAATAEGDFVPCSTATLAQSIERIFGTLQQQQIHPESYEEAKRLLVFAGLFFLLMRFVQRIKENRLRERQNLLFSLNLSGSLTNLSPSQLHEQICWRHRQRFYSANVPPSYEQIGRCPLVSPPAFVVCANNNNQRQQQQQQQRHKEAPPKYKAIANEPNGSRSSSEEDISPPSYDERIQNNGP